MRRSPLFLSPLTLSFFLTAPAFGQTAPAASAPPPAPEQVVPADANSADSSTPAAAAPKEELPAESEASPAVTEEPDKTEPEEFTAASAEEEAGTSAEEKTEEKPPAEGLNLAQPEPKEETPYTGPRTLLGGEGEKLHIGGYGGISVRGTSLNDSAGVLVGGEGALLLGHRLAIGGAGYGLASEVDGPLVEGDRSVLGFGYGGAVFRYHIMSERSPVTASIGTLVGAGGLTLVRKLTDDYQYDVDDETDANAFFVVEPSVQVNLHLTRWMRFGIDGSYRFVRGPSLGEVEDADLEGIAAGAHVQFGWF